MERKEFLSLVGISVGAVILQNCMSGCSKSSDPTPVTITPTTPTIPSTGGGTTSTGLTGNNEIGKGTIDFSLDLTSTTFKVLQTNGTALVSGDVIIARTKAGDFLAVAKACTHQGTTVDFIADDSTFKCNNHGSVFDSSGSVTVGPASSALKKYATTFDKEKNSLKVG
ncbi:Rieske (2Fe-2S) protein [Arcicella sp. LKC2W]|uniref:QcrA and Rieske domain-containing protein n=1 Tax=Arcicella sp. LKC2W TaxID=2984198 RepID=UPI002B215B87|nr:Rieske (2Fe-2S) protein [Arcicella sp. LKC2W]MEA5458490.1 Rieske (2Fe-2S) protein [Arcicella sp. LKC2W]